MQILRSVPMHPFLSRLSLDRPRFLAACAGVAAPLAIAPVALASPLTLAQLFYPPVSNSPGIMVVGRGRASHPADLARLTFSVYRDSYSFEEGFEQARRDRQPNRPLVSSGIPSLLPSAHPASWLNAESLEGEELEITEADIAAVLDALAAQGINPEQITQEFGTLDAYTAEVTVELPQPTQGRVQAIVEAVQEAMADRSPVYLQDVSVVYSLADCIALEVDAYGAAVADGRQRAAAIAANMGVSLVNPPSVAESLFNLVVPGCDSVGPEFPPFFGGFGSGDYDPEQPAEVEVFRDVFMTYPVE